MYVVEEKFRFYHRKIACVASRTTNPLGGVRRNFLMVAKTQKILIASKFEVKTSKGIIYLVFPFVIKVFQQVSHRNSMFLKKENKSFQQK